MMQDVHRKFKSDVVVAKANFSEKIYPFQHQVGLSLTKKLVVCYISSTALYGAESEQFGK
jgi:hypothetical protein